MTAGFLKPLKFIHISEVIRPAEDFSLYITTNDRAVLLDKLIVELPDKFEVPE
ncbi:hypothetical protein ES703_39947 [subsurface metagenome]